MEALRHLSDTELDTLFESVSGVELGEKEFVALLRGDPRGALRKVGLGRVGRLFVGLVRGWIRAAIRH
jgi:hypothetical protein